MIRLVASDIDGTLLQGGAQQIDTRLFSLIDALRAKNILFCAASGRQYASLRRLFAPVADSILYSCENGSIVYYHDAVLAKTALPRDQCEQLTAQILAQPGCEVLISGANTCYVAPKNEAYFHHISEELGNHTRRIACLGDVPEEIIKISAFCDRPAGEYEAMFSPVWNHHLNVAVAGKFWLDFTLAHKGTALAQISDALSISARDMLAFGDNFNDIPMFRFAGDSYAMENADPAVKAAAAHTCSSVTCVLEHLL